MYGIIPESCKPVEAISPATNGSALTGDYISLKHAQAVYVVLHVTQANADTLVITINQATAVDGTGATAITQTVPIWANLDCAASDTLVARTAAVSYETDAGLKHKIVIFQILPEHLDDGYDVITVVSTCGSAANITQAMYFVEGRVAKGTPPTNITD